MFGFFEEQVNKLYSTLAPEYDVTEKFFAALASGDVAYVNGQIESQAFDVNFRNKKGNAPVHIAAHSGRKEMLDYLLERGADYRACGANGNTCLHFAAVKGHLEMVKMFIELGLSPLQKNGNGKTAYDIAQGFGVKQYLMPLMFNEERRTGSAPVVTGATVDPTVQAQRLANIAPPPKGSALNYESGTTFSQNNRSLNSSTRTTEVGTTEVQSGSVNQSGAFQSSGMLYEPDGFGSTVGNPRLAAKYGNVSSYDDGRGINKASAPSPVIYNHEASSQSPFARGRYVVYGNVGSSSQPVACGMPLPVKPRNTSPYASGNNGINCSIFSPSSGTTTNPPGATWPQQATSGSFPAPAAQSNHSPRGMPQTLGPDVSEGMTTAASNSTLDTYGVETRSFEDHSGTAHMVCNPEISGNLAQKVMQKEFESEEGSFS